MTERVLTEGAAPARDARTGAVKTGVDDDLVRISVGVESGSEILDDMIRALAVSAEA